MKPKKLNVKVPPEIELTREERDAIETLEKLARKWPKSLMFFSAPHGLCVLKVGSNEVLATLNIHTDGGDPGGYTDEKTGREFLSL